MMLCPDCGNEIRPNKGWAAQFYDGYCNHCDKPVGDAIDENSIKCDPDVCPNCTYIGDGDSLCDVIQEIVLSDWELTDEAMGEGCPYRRKSIKVKPRRKHQKKRRQQ